MSASPSRLINPSDLTEQTRQVMWAGIKRLDPALADMLVNDENISELKASMGATLRFTQDAIDRYIADGIKQFEERHNVKKI